MSLKNNKLRLANPTAENNLLVVLEGLMDSFKKGNTVAVVEVSDLYSRADNMDRENSLIVTLEAPPGES